MKNHWSFKALCLILAVLSGAVLVLGGLGIGLSRQVGLAERAQDMDRWQEFYQEAHWLAESLAGHYAMEHSDLSEADFREFVGGFPALPKDAEFDYEIFWNGEDRVLESTLKEKDYDYMTNHYYSVPELRIHELKDPNFQPGFGEYKAMLEPEELQMPELADFPEPADGTQYFRYEFRDGRTYRLDVLEGRTYNVTIAMSDAQLTALIGEMDLGTLPEAFRMLSLNLWIIVTAAAAAVWILSMILLCLMAGKAPGTDEIRAAGLNRLPLDLWTAVLGTGWLCCLLLPLDVLDTVIYVDGASANWFLVGLCAAGTALTGLPALLGMAISAQVREKIWLDNLLLTRIVKAVFRFCTTWGRRVCRWIGGKARRLWNVVREPIRKLPMTWQWLMAFGLVWLIAMLALLIGGGAGMILLLILAPLGGLTVFYFAGAYGKLHEAARKMAEGNLDTKINTEDPWFGGCFGEFAADLNTLGDTCVEAAKRQMKSERMKTELITNVSHDIKTPLTSIINYVDLLRSAETEDQKAEYLEVLDRQSHSLKKLIEDLMEMSRASSGNVSAELVPTDVGEAVSQALGEFADRLEEKQLQLVQSGPREPVMALADGKLLWRVLSNLLGNVVKYALPGTRVYADLTRQDGRTRITVKNISARPLNISADELLERFVRGDASRNTEGNGLGLNIARSLMEVQHGTLEVSVDGDLFKVTLELPNAENQ